VWSVAALALGAIALGGCSSSGGDTAATPTPEASASQTPSPSAAAPSPSQTTAASSSAANNVVTAEFNKQVQEHLNAVGCHAGPVDGVLGGETDAAVLRFQQAAGLTADGELGPQTEAALAKAAAAGDTVCTQAPTATPTPTATHSSGVTCSAASISTALKQNETITRFVCTDAFEDRWAAGKVIRGGDGAEYSFFARVDGDTWIRVSSDDACGKYGAALPQQLADFCSDGE
jgi:peptidoglycan hydrolase-like protein with peptidoglycan-binding domain